MFDVRNLNVAYGQSQVLHGINMSIAPGEIVAVVGRNGMGKSTLMKSLIGTMPSRSGQVMVDGTDVSKLPSHARVSKGLAYVPQGREIFPLLTVEENLKTGFGPLKRDQRSIPDDVFSLFPVLENMLGRRGGDLSGGQQQQLAIGRALVMRPKLLLLDEPTEGIQPSIIKDIGRLLKEIRQLRNLCIVVCEQLLSFVMDVADRILVMENGRIIHSDTRANVDEAKIAGYLAV